jgi:hypothetical protein
MAIIPVLGRLKQKVVDEFKDSLSNIPRPHTHTTHRRPIN